MAWGWLAVARGGGGEADSTQGETIWSSLGRQKVKHGLLSIINILWVKATGYGCCTIRILAVSYWSPESQISLLPVQQHFTEQPRQGSYGKVLEEQMTIGNISSQPLLLSPATLFGAGGIYS